MDVYRSVARCVLLAGLTASTTFAGVFAVNDAVPYPQLLGPAGTSENPTIFKYDTYTRDFGELQGLDIGTYNPFIQLHVVNNSKITSSKIWFVGGDYPNKKWESQKAEDYPGSQMLLIDQSSMSTGELRVGSKNSNNTVLLKGKASLHVGQGLYINRHEGVINSKGVSGNTVRVTGGSTLAVSGGDVFVGYGDSSKESLIVTDGSTVKIGDDTTSRRLRLRFSHESLVRVSGNGSKVVVTGGMSLGESSQYCYGNNLVLEDGGELWIRNASGGSPVSTTFVTGNEMNKILLAKGSLVVYGNQTQNTGISEMIWVCDGRQYVDGTIGDVSEEGKFSAAYHTEGKYAGYTVFTGGVVPEPTSISTGLLSLALVGRRGRT